MVESPLFLVGVGRSGSSFLAHLISHHGDLGFLTGVVRRSPSNPWRNRLVLRLLDQPIIGSRLQKRVGIEEAYPFWERNAPGFSEPMRDLRAEDVTPFVRRTLIPSLDRAVPSFRWKLFAKFTGWSRIGYLSELFPDARFVHLVRDGRDVANSLLRVPFWRGWGGPHHWRFGPLSEENQQVWEEHDHSFVVLAGLTWKLLVDAVEVARQELSEKGFHEVRYEDFIHSPRKEIGRIVDFAGLGWDRRLDRIIDHAAFRDPSGRHTDDLSSPQVDTLTRVLEVQLQRYGYL